MRSFLLAASIFAAFSAGALAQAERLGGAWQIVSVSGAEALDASRSHAEFAGDRFASTVGCNRISGSAALSESQLSFGPMASTRMACPPPLDGVERQYLAALQDVRAYRLEGARLLFLGGAGEALVTLEREK
jgi:heat shock protein HslJ